MNEHAIANVYSYLYVKNIHATQRINKSHSLWLLLVIIIIIIVIIIIIIIIFFAKACNYSLTNSHFRYLRIQLDSEA